MGSGSLPSIYTRRPIPSRVMVKVRHADEFALLHSSDSRGAGPLARKDDHWVSGLEAVKERNLDGYGAPGGATDG
jgi:hypothetical protein